MIRQPEQDETPLSAEEQKIAQRLDIKPKRINRKRFWWREEQKPEQFVSAANEQMMRFS